MANACRAGDTAAAIEAGLAPVPEDQRQQGLVMELSVERNATLPPVGTDERRAAVWGEAKRRKTRFGLSVGAPAPQWERLHSALARALADLVAS